MSKSLIWLQLTTNVSRETTKKSRLFLTYSFLYINI
nr:MAG TPA: hypothetical protein [Caudoviricetes sp.]